MLQIRDELGGADMEGGEGGGELEGCEEMAGDEREEAAGLERNSGEVTMEARSEESVENEGGGDGSSA